MGDCYFVYDQKYDYKIYKDLSFEYESVLIRSGIKFIDVPMFHKIIDNGEIIWALYAGPCVIYEYQQFDS